MTDLVDNQLDTVLGNEALYVETLNIEGTDGAGNLGAILDLNGLNLYYLNGDTGAAGPRWSGRSASSQTKIVGK